jgi:hypothetical protein
LPSPNPEGSGMTVLEELRLVAAKFTPAEHRATCPWCSRGRVDVVEETPDPIYGALGMVTRTLRCDAPDCGRLTID